MDTITVTNQKGGVAKTTTSLMLAAGLAMKGYRVLGIDLDPQGNFTTCSNPDRKEGPTVYDMLKGAIRAEEAISGSPHGYDIIRGSYSLALADQEFSDTGREYILSEALEPIEDRYDYCIIDTPPSLSILTVNALTASKSVIVPIAADLFSLEGLERLYGLTKKVRKYSNSRLRIEGLLLTRYSGRAIISKAIREQLEAVAHRYETRLFNTTIREGVAIKEAQFLKKNPYKDYSKAKVTQDYADFINELLKEAKEDGKQEE